jgi:hypothetical protein
MKVFLKVAAMFAALFVFTDSSAARVTGSSLYLEPPTAVAGLSTTTLLPAM